MKTIEEVIFSGRLGRAIARVIGKPGSLRFRLARDTVGVMAIQGLSMALGFVLSVVLARLLGVREFGLYSLAMSVLGLLVVPATFGFPQLLVREIAAYRVKGEWGLIWGLLRFARRTSLLASLGLALLGGLALWLLADRFSGEAAMVLALAFVALPLWALLQLHGAALRGFEQILAGQWASTVMQPLCFLILTGAAWLFAGRLSAASFALGLHMIATGIALAFAVFLLRNRVTSSVPADPFNKNTSTWVRSALSLAFLALLNLIPQHAGILLLGWMRSVEEVGLYKVAYQTASLNSFGLMVVNIAISPTFSQLSVRKDKHKFRYLLFIATGASLFLALPFALIFILSPSEFLTITFSKNFVDAKEPLKSLSIAFLIQILAGPLWQALLMSGYERNLLFITGIASILNLVFNITFVPALGVKGAALALNAYYIFILVLTLFVVWREKQI